MLDHCSYSESDIKCSPHIQEYLLTKSRPTACVSVLRRLEIGRREYCPFLSTYPYAQHLLPIPFLLSTRCTQNGDQMWGDQCQNYSGVQSLN